MSFTPRWHSAAFDDLRTGYKWYEERLPGLGSDFAREADATIKHATSYPLMPRKYEHPQLPAEPWVRKVQLQRFDEYGLFYTVFNDAFWIVAIAHSKQKPGYWIDRLSQLS